MKLSIKVTYKHMKFQSLGLITIYNLSGAGKYKLKVRKSSAAAVKQKLRL